jgi:hypothetical protein
VILCLPDGFDNILMEPFVPDRTVVALDISVLLGLTRLDVADADPVLFCAGQQLCADVFGPIIDTDASRLAAPFDDPVQTADDPLSR